MPKTFADFDTTINQALKDWHIPGAAVAVAKGDTILHSGGYGLRDVEQGLPVTENTRFPIASMTKPFTAMGAAILVEEGLLDWDQPIRDVLPEFRLYDDYSTKHATLRDLLSHRTGLPRHDSTWYGSDKPFEEIFEELRYLKPTQPFRSLWQYNNLMYETVGMLCAKIAGVKNWDEFIQTRILDPLGLTDTTPRYQENGKQFEDIALPYQLKNDETEPQRLPFYNNTLGPAGSIYSTLNDVLSWIKLHATNGESNGTQLVSPYNLKQMHTPHMLMPATAGQEMMFNNNLYAYGMAWFIEPYEGVTLIHHGGNINGFSVMGAFVPQQDISIVVLTNIDGKGLRNALMYEALDRALEVEGRDWCQEFLNRNNETVQAAIKATETMQEDQLSGAPASHELAQYAGTYAAAGYRDIAVKWEDDRLWLQHYGDWWPLDHVHYDTFDVDMSERYDEKLRIGFSLDFQGAISSLAFPIEPDLPDQLYKRQPLVLDSKSQDLLIGEYDFPVEGQSVVIASDEGKLTLTITGSPKPLHCVQQSADQIDFKLGGGDRSTVEFIKGKQGYQRMVIKLSGATYECQRLG
jgi:CubicO group peptidase (beta-lactamase class C family)